MARREEVERARAFVDVAKAGRLCADCGGTFHHAAMRFEHREGVDKRSAIGRMVQAGVTNEELAAEIEKCDLICANCHAVREHQRANQFVEFEP